jgi:hypothetical protein
MQLLSEHVKPAEQCMSSVQSIRQALSPHVYGLHATGAPSTHVPCPLHVNGCSSLPEHVASAQLTVVPGYVQLDRLLPSQVPAHVSFSASQAGRSPCGSPVTLEHVPALSMTSHASHWPLQALLQQTPSTQLVDAH